MADIWLSYAEKVGTERARKGAVSVPLRWIWLRYRLAAHAEARKGTEGTLAPIAVASASSSSPG
jgi:hypothetical protein